MGFTLPSSFSTSRAFAPLSGFLSALALFAGLPSVSLARPAAEADTRLLLAQAGPSDDPYGIESPTTPRADSPSTPAATPPTVPAPRADSPAVAPLPAAPVVDTARAGTVRGDTAASAPDTTPRTPRPRITRETTINPMDVHKGSYRNPKKALFMSLMVPGLGQAYIGQSTFNYVRAAVYFGTDVTLGALWYQFSVVKYDRQVKKYRSYADEHWDQRLYEDSVAQLSGQVEQDRFDQFNPYRKTYCGAVQSSAGSASAAVLKGCQEPWNSAVQNDYQFFLGTLAGDTNIEVRRARRAGFPDAVDFYDLIGRNQEFIFGWDDANEGGALYNFTDTTVDGTSAHRSAYNSMRQTAKEYSRMQAWFLGGIVLNHIASAVDAALTARRHNRILYEEGDARWYDRVNVDGGMALDVGRPRTYMTASLSF